MSDPSIFVVDDEPKITETLSLILEMSGYSVGSFLNPFEALNAAAIKAPDILLTDVIMPGMNGIELAIIFKSLYPKTKIVILSGNPRADDITQGAEDDGLFFTRLYKPLTPKDLLAALRRVQQQIQYSDA